MSQHDRQCRHQTMCSDSQKCSFVVTCMQVAIKCILIALRGCHALHWAINDIRWSNIIFVGDIHGGKWWLIDCEHAQKFGYAFPRIRTYAVNPGNVCNASSDLALVAALLTKVDNLLQSSNDLIQLQSKLESSRQRRSMSAVELLELPWLKALDTPPSSSSSGTLCCNLMFLAFSTREWLQKLHVFSGSGEESSAPPTRVKRTPGPDEVASRRSTRFKTG